MEDPIRILYVDDEPALLEIGKLFLEREGIFTVDTLTSARLALSKIKTEWYDVIISDYEMPEMNGIMFLKELKKSGNTTPFIIFTGRGREEVVIEALNEGADFYLQKGGDPKSQFVELVHKIHHAISRQHAVKALNKSEQDYRHLVEHANEAIYVVQDGLFRMINPKLSEITGYSEQELLSLPITTFIHPDDHATVLDRYERRLRGEPVIRRYTFRLSRKDKTIRWGELSADIISWDGRPATLVFLTDITDSKIAEDALRESEERYHQFFKTTLDSVFITTLEGQWIDFNDALVAMFGYQNREEMFLVPVPSIYAHPEERTEFLKIVEQEGYIQEHPLQFKKRDGTVFDTLITIVAQRNPDGSLKYFIGSFRDITNRKIAEEALKESESQYRNIFESFEDLYYQTDMDGIITILSPSLYRLTGWKPEELIGKPANTLYIQSEDRNFLLEEIEKYGSVQDYELPLQKRDGTYTAASLSATRIYHPDGSPSGVAGILRDISGRKQIENALRDSEQKFRYLVEYVLEGILILDFQGKILFTNIAAAKTIEVDDCAELIGRNVMEFIAPESRDDVINDFIQVSQGHDAYLAHYHIISAKGNRIYIESIGKVLSYEGKPADLISIRDITEQKKIEDTLQEQEENYRHIIENSHDIIYTLTNEGVLTFVSPSWTPHLGYHESSAVGKKITEFIHSDDRDRYQDFLKRVIQTGSNISGIEFRMQHSNGSWHWFNSNGTPIRDLNGKVIGCQAIARDVTERKLAEEALIESESRYRNIFESFEDLYYQTDMNGCITFLSPSLERLTGWKPEELIGKQATVLYVHPEDREFLLREIEKNGSVRDYELLLQKRDGTQTPESVSASRIYHPDGTPAGIGGVLRDITRRKQAEEALHEANHKLHLLTGLTRHDIINKLCAIEILLDMTLNMSNPDEIHEYISRAREVNQQIEETVGFTREYETFGTVSCGWQRIYPIIESAKKEVTLDNILINNRIPEDLEIYGDPIIRKIFSTLMENAVRHGEIISKICFSCNENEQSFKIVCEDDGVGVQPEQKDHIFDHGYGNHTGIGLFLAREILSITGLSISECGVPGKGARFEISIPTGKFRRHPANEEY